MGDHIALPTTAPDDPYQPRLEALITLAHLAAVTARVKLGCGVIILPQRQPVLLAKQLTSIDVLSGGRLIVGLGVGYVEQELSALGVAMSERGARTDEYVAAMQALWDEPAPAFEGAVRRFQGRAAAAAAGPAAVSAARVRRCDEGVVAAGARARRLLRLGPDA